MFSLLRKEILNSNIYSLMETHSIKHDHLVDEDIKSILDALEKAGMLPPPTYIKTFDKYDNIWDNEEDDL